MYAVHYLLGVAAAALIGFALGAMIRGIAAHLSRPPNAAETEKATRRGGFLYRMAAAVGAPLAMLGLWLFALTDLATWGQPVLAAGAALGAALGWWTGPALRDAFITRAPYRPAKGRRRRSDDETLPNPFTGEAPMDDAGGDGPLSFRDDDSPP